MTNKQQIQEIVKAIQITPQRKLLLNGQLWGEEFTNPYMSEPNNKMLFQSLQQLIYSVFYTRSPLKKNNSFPSVTEIEEFIQELSQHNNSAEQFDPGWQIEHIDTAGNIIAAKGNYKRVIYPGEFVNESSFHQKPSVHTTVKLFARKEYRDLNSGFYYLFGNTLAEDNNELLVRLYFNLVPESAKKLLRVLSTCFNKYKIPFSFKCLYHPSLYNRADAAVLYFDKRYSRIVFRLLPGVYSTIQPMANANIPLFTKKIAPGIGFAENPANPEESFGTHTSKMIAQGIMHCFTNNLTPDKWYGEIIGNIEKRHGYKDVELLYLNPGTAYPYEFPKIDF